MLPFRFCCICKDELITAVSYLSNSIAEPFSKIVGLDGEVSAGADKDVGDDNDGNEAAILEKQSSLSILDTQL